MLFTLFENREREKTEVGDVDFGNKENNFISRARISSFQ